MFDTGMRASIQKWTQSFMQVINRNSSDTEICTRAVNIENPICYL
jgi:hypothetical protein